MQVESTRTSANGARVGYPVAQESTLVNQGIQIIDVAVQVDPATNQWTYNGSSSLTVEVLPGQALIRLLLGSNALYVSNPVDWFSVQTDVPIPTPSGLSVSRDSNDMVSILDFNPGNVQMQLGFRLTVQAGGTILTSPDPTIINRKTD